MSEDRNLPHIRVPASFRSSHKYKAYSSGGGGSKPDAPTVTRTVHGASLSRAIESAAQSVAESREIEPLVITGATPGVYLEFESFPGWDLVLKGMESTAPKDVRKHVEVVAVSKEGSTDDKKKSVQRAAVFVPEGEIGHFLKQLEKYVNPTPKRYREVRYEDVYDRIASVRSAVLQALWTDDVECYPEEAEKIWWEVWLRRTDGAELERLYEFCEHVGAKVGLRRLVFEERIVTLVFASAKMLSSSLEVMGDIAELQRAKETAHFFVQERPEDQAHWTLDLLKRSKASHLDSPYVCLFDTGVNSAHPLLRDSLADEDRHSCHPEWGLDDNGGGPRMEGHGTEMAGLALYGDLVEPMLINEPVTLAHRLESVKILPPRGETAPELYAAITAEATSRPEVHAPKRRRVFSMAVTSKDGRDRGQPTSWSAAVDALVAGRSFDANDKGLKYLDDEEEPPFRLFILSAGNVDPVALELDHISRSDLEQVHDPAQAWNALTVGAYTDLGIIEDTGWKGWSRLAERGDLSPWSTTSVLFESTWPVKPDVVFEGGNVVHDGTNIDFPCDDLCLLTTHYKPHEKTLVTTWATSAASALCARFCALISSEFPMLWPETIRALVVHSARWTPTMLSKFSLASNKGERGALLRRYGFGVPSLERAIRSASSSVTLIIEDTIHPFEDGEMRELHLHKFPWPKEVLQSLGEVSTRVRVTLSYFVEPNPGRRGWQSKHRYQSHGLRFEMKGPTEHEETFRKRLNKAALGEEEKRPKKEKGIDGWYLGTNARDKGSIHSDIFESTAADIAARGMLAVYPVTEWWKDQKSRDRSSLGARYALIVSIETDSAEADIWTPIATEVGIPIPIS